MEALGIGESSKFAIGLAKMVSVQGRVWEDGKLTATDSLHLYSLGQAAIELAFINYGTVFREAQDYDEKEIGQLVTDFGGAFDLPNDIVEAEIKGFMGDARIAFEANKRLYARIVKMKDLAAARVAAAKAAPTPAPKAATNATTGTNLPKRG